VAKEREVELVKRTLVKNKYPESLVENIKNKRKNKKDEGEKTKPDGTLIIPYIASLGEKISRIAKKINIRTVFTS
jgi:vacuolar-type H+-ATPase subunit I/STV1